MSQALNIVGGIPWFAWIPIVAIICGCVANVFKMHYRHVERIEMIRQGVNPDTPATYAKAYAERDI